MSHQLILLGGFDLLRQGESVAMAPSAQRLLAFVALASRPLRRTHIAGVLWPDTDDHKAAASLRSALWRMRCACKAVVRLDKTHVALGDDVRVDIHRATELARALTATNPTAAYCDDDSMLLSCELLPDWYDDWVVSEREHFRQLRLHALEARCKQLTVSRHYVAAVEVGLAAVSAEPLRESAHHVLISAHLAEGNTAEAIRQYGVCRDLLQANLGVEPSRSLGDLMAQA